MLFLLLLSCTPQPGGSSCDFEDAVDTVVDGEEVDCGAIAEDADGTEQWACAIEAWRAGEAYQVRWDVGGSDSLLAYAQVFDGEQTWELIQDRLKSGPWEITAVECVDPYEGTWPDEEYDDEDVFGFPAILCGSYAPEDNEYLVCDVGNRHGPDEPLAWPP